MASPSPQKSCRKWDHRFNPGSAQVEFTFFPLKKGVDRPIPTPIAKSQTMKMLQGLAVFLWHNITNKMKSLVSTSH